MEIKDIKDSYQGYVQRLRRELHEQPELSYQEFETTKRIARELDTMGIPYEITDRNIGIVAWIDGDMPGKTVALRADIDGLPVQETNTFDFASKQDGVMHACGHDGHTAIVLGAARMLLEVKNRIQGRVYLIFQPAEEVGTGAEFMRTYGDWYEKTDCIFGGHVWVDLPAGKVNIEAGPRMAATDKWTVKITGKNAHGSRPHEGIDSVLVASAIVMNLQSIVSRNYSALDSVVLSVTRITSGNTWNVVPGEAELEGTSRYFRREVRPDIMEKFERIVKNTAAAYGATATIEYQHVAWPLINEEEPSQVGVEAVAAVLGDDALAPMEKIMAGEDFATYQLDKPSSFAFVGIANPEVGAVYAHHNNNFNMDDSVLSDASAVYAEFALRWLDKHANEDPSAQ